MIGDAPGDLEAAQSAQASFYPIIPGREEESWSRLLEKGLPEFFAGTYRGEFENQLKFDFLKILKPCDHS